MEATEEPDLDLIASWWKSSDPDLFLGEVLGIYSDELFNKLFVENQEGFLEKLENYWKTSFDPYACKLFYYSGDWNQEVMKNLILRYPIYEHTLIASDWKEEVLKRVLGCSKEEIDKSPDLAVDKRFAIVGPVKTFAPGMEQADIYYIHTWGIDQGKFNLELDKWKQSLKKVFKLITSAADEKTDGKRYTIRMGAIGMGNFLASSENGEEFGKAFFEVASMELGSRNLIDIQICIRKGSVWLPKKPDYLKLKILEEDLYSFDVEDDTRLFLVNSWNSKSWMGNVSGGRDSSFLHNPFFLWDYYIKNPG